MAVSLRQCPAAPVKIREYARWLLLAMVPSSHRHRLNDLHQLRTGGDHGSDRRAQRNAEWSTRTTRCISGSGGMSPITMAILGAVADKAMNGFTGGQPSTSPANTQYPRVTPPSTRCARWRDWRRIGRSAQERARRLLGPLRPEASSVADLATCLSRFSKTGTRSRGLVGRHGLEQHNIAE